MSKLLPPPLLEWGQALSTSKDVHFNQPDLALKPKSSAYQEHYYGSDDPIAEVRHVFLEGNDLPQSWQGQAQFTIGEIGFGSGLNFLCLMELWLNSKHSPARLDYISCEKAPFSKQQFEKAFAGFPSLVPNIQREFLNQLPPPLKGFHLLHLCGGKIRLLLLYGEARQNLCQLDAKINAWFLDGFSPSVNPELWNQDLCLELARLSHPNASLASFTVAGKVRDALTSVGFELAKRQGFGMKKHNLMGKFNPSAQNQLKIKPLYKPWFNSQKPIAAKNRIAIIGNGIAATLLSSCLSQQGHSITQICLPKTDHLSNAASTLLLGVLAPNLDGGDIAFAKLNEAFYFHSLRYYQAMLAPLYPAPALHRGIEVAKQERLLSSLEWPNTFIDQIEDDQTKLLEIKNAPLFRGQEILAHFKSNPQNLIQAFVKTIERKEGEWLIKDEAGHIIFQAPYLIIAAGAGSKSLLTHYRLGLTNEAACIELKSNDIEIRSHSEYGKGLITASLDGKYAEIGKIDPLGKPSSPHYWQAMRVISQDRLPLCGHIADQAAYLEAYGDLHHGRQHKLYPPAPYIEGLYVLTGLGARGFQAAPLLAEMLSAQICGTPLPIPAPLAEALHPARFLIRNLKRRKEGRI